MVSSQLLCRVEGELVHWSVDLLPTITNPTATDQASNSTSSAVVVNESTAIHAAHNEPTPHVSKVCLLTTRSTHQMTRADGAEPDLCCVRC